MNYATSTDSASAHVAERSLFLRRVYGHLALALLGFVALEAFLLSIPSVRAAAIGIASKGGGMWLVVMLGFMGVSFLAQKMATSNTSVGTQYGGLALYVVAQALIFLPLIGFVMMRGEGGTALLSKAGLITGGLFLGLTTVALTTEKDLSFMQRFIKIGMWVALGIIVASLLFGFSLGIIFMSAMILLMSACILWETQQIQREWPSEMYVAASLTLFASFATLLWYVIQFLMSFTSRE